MAFWTQLATWRIPIRHSQVAGKTFWEVGLFLKKLGYDESIFKGRKPVVKAHLCQLFWDIYSSVYVQDFGWKIPMKWKVAQVMEDLRHDERLEASVHEDCVEADDRRLVEWIWMFPKIVGFPPKSSILIGFSIINHPFWGTLIFGKHPYKDIKWGVSLNGGFPLISHPKCWSFLLGKPHGFVRETQHFRSCPHMNHYRDPP